MINLLSELSNEYPKNIIVEREWKQWTLWS
jgi:hypothetical protein